MKTSFSSSSAELMFGCLDLQYSPSDRCHCHMCLFHFWRVFFPVSLFSALMTSHRVIGLPSGVGCTGKVFNALKEPAAEVCNHPIPGLLARWLQAS